MDHRDLGKRGVGGRSTLLRRRPLQLASQIGLYLLGTPHELVVRSEEHRAQLLLAVRHGVDLRCQRLNLLRLISNVPTEFCYLEPGGPPLLAQLPETALSNTNAVRNLWPSFAPTGARCRILERFIMALECPRGWRYVRRWYVRACRSVRFPAAP